MNDNKNRICDELIKYISELSLLRDLSLAQWELRDFQNEFYNYKYISEMSLDQYVIWKWELTRGSFCYYLEYLTKYLWSTWWNSYKYWTFYSKTRDDYVFSWQYVSENDALEQTIQFILNVLNWEKLSNINTLVSPLISRKIYYLYNPEEIIPIYIEEYLDKIINYIWDLEIDSNDDYFSKNKKILKFFTEWWDGSIFENIKNEINKVEQNISLMFWQTEFIILLMFFFFYIIKNEEKPNFFNLNLLKEEPPFTLFEVIEWDINISLPKFYERTYLWTYRIFFQEDNFIQPIYIPLKLDPIISSNLFEYNKKFNINFNKCELTLFSYIWDFRDYSLIYDIYWEENFKKFLNSINDISILDETIREKILPKPILDKLKKNGPILNYDEILLKVKNINLSPAKYGLNINIWEVLKLNWWYSSLYFKLNLLTDKIWLWRINSIIWVNWIWKTTILEKISRLLCWIDFPEPNSKSYIEYEDPNQNTNNNFNKIICINLANDDRFNFYYDNFSQKRSIKGNNKIEAFNLNNETNGPYDLSNVSNYVKNRFIKIFNDNERMIFEDVIINNNIDKLNRLSSWFRSILKILILCVKNIEKNTLIILDEPETHLHPDFVSKLFIFLNDLLKEYDSFAIIWTHSPIVIQQIPSKYIINVTQVWNSLQARNPSIECFWNNLSEIINDIFGWDERNSFYVKQINNLLKSWISSEEIKKELWKWISLSLNILLDIYSNEKNWK